MTASHKKLSASTKMKITHIQVMHSISSHFGLSEDAKEEVTYSQFKTARIILKDPNAAVFLESLYANLGPEDRKSSMLSKQMEEILESFSAKKFPREYGALKEPQKKCLYKYGGAAVLYCLGLISHLYKTISQEIEEFINSQTPNLNRTGMLDSDEAVFVVDARDRIAFSHITHLSEMRSRPVFLVFGSKHLFKCIKEDASVSFKTISTLKNISEINALLAIEPYKNLAIADLKETPDVPTYLYSTNRFAKIFARIDIQNDSKDIPFKPRLF